ncbi:MAG: ABC transporter permease [Longimicrobiales bacterium]
MSTRECRRIVTRMENERAHIIVGLAAVFAAWVVIVLVIKSLRSEVAADGGSVLWIEEIAAPSGDSSSASHVSPVTATRLLEAKLCAIRAIGVHDTFTVALSGVRGVEHIKAAAVSSGWHEAIGVLPIIGRPLHPLSLRDEPGTVALISHELWQRLFGAQVNVIRAKVTLDGAPVAVVGVVPAGFHFPARTDIWMPLDPAAGEEQGHRLFAFARARQGISDLAVNAELLSLSHRNGAQQLRVRPMTEPSAGPPLEKAGRDAVACGIASLSPFLHGLDSRESVE